MSTQEVGINVYKERVFPVLFMFIVTAVFIAMVSGVYLATQETVSRNEQLYLKRAVLFAAGLDIPDQAGKLDALYEERIREVTTEDGDIRYYEVQEPGGSVSGYVVPAAGPGLWGEIGAVVGYENDLKTLTGVDFIKQNETPGLGGRITEKWFREQFDGKRAPFSMVPEGTEGESATEFDAITGATLTSTSVKNILNNVDKQAAEIVRQGS